MSYNVTGATQVPLELWGGLVTEMPAANLPSGVSPDCADVVFIPGAVRARPALTQVMPSSFSANLTYAKSYVANDGTIRNLYLDDLGNLTVENITTSAGTKTLIGTVTPGSYAKSVTADGREYIAFSDGIHGSDVPLQYDGTNLDRVTQDGPGTPPVVTNTIIAPTNMSAAATGFTMVRGFSHPNVVQVYTASAHNLKVGYQAIITGVPAAPVNFVSSIVINNDDLPGIATVTVSTPHGLKPGTFVIIQDVSPQTVATINTVTRNGEIVVCVTNAPHNLQIGAQIVIAGCSDSSFDSTFTVANVIDDLSFSFFQSDPTNAGGAGGTITIVWPVSSTATAPTYFEVIAVPSTTTFQVQVAYSSGTWTTGAVFFPWDGTFFVTAVINSTSFQYQQYGPDAATTAVGLVTPHGQVSPGIHQMQVLFETRMDYVTAPSPPVTFVANGGQYLTISDIPIGPPNVISRIIAFTGADGQFFFYLPVPAMVNSQQVSTSTQINDNTTTSILVDFSDPSLFGGISINTQGNDLPNQIVLDSALGFAFYGLRLITYGQRNVVQSFRNMGFDGGALPSSPTLPTGWIATGSPAVAGGVLATGHYGIGWHFTGAGSIYQTAYLDWEGAPILTGDTQYFARAWMSGSGTAVLDVSSASTGFSMTATLTSPGAVGGFVEATFMGSSPIGAIKTPTMIPSDMILTLSGDPGVLIDCMSIIFSEVPFIDRTFFASYVNNPEAFDGVSGVFGAADDTRKIMTCGIIRGALAHLTQEPSGRLHSTINNGTTEPVGWTTNEVASNCGAMSAFCMAVSQADDATAAGGEEWLAWMSYTGLRIFGGDQPWKISQEIQPDWDAINSGTWLTTWCLNDFQERRIYCGLPKGLLANFSPGISATAPNKIYHVDYKNLDTAFEIAQSPPIHVAYSGKLAARDHARKWAPWNMPANGAAMIYRVPGGPLSTVFYLGNGQLPGVSPAGCSNIYALCPGRMTDDCLGQIYPYYTTYAFTSAELEQGMQLGGQRHLLYYLQWLALGTGNIKVTIFVNTLSNPWPVDLNIPLRVDPDSDDEWGGGNAAGQRFFIRFDGLPVAATGPS